jgi:hypothetical protein
MKNKPLVTTGVASMLAGNIFFMSQNIKLHAYPLPAALLLWLLFGVMAAIAGDNTYNSWQARAKNSFQRFLMLWTIIGTIFLAAYIFAKIAFLFS